jgi:hypothetical protein
MLKVLFGKKTVAPDVQYSLNGKITEGSFGDLIRLSIKYTFSR